MSIDIDGTMIVGRWGEELIGLTEIEDIYDFLVEDHAMDTAPTYYDAPVEHVIFGYVIDDVDVNDIDGEWLKTVKEKAALFREITGLDPELMGTQNVW